MKIRREEFAGLVDELAAGEICWWPVANDYKIAGGWIYPEGSCPDLSIPLEDPGLFLSFARLGAQGNPSDGSILRWAKRHGLLLREDDRRPAWNDDWEKGYLENQAPMKVEDFRAEVKRARDLLEFYTELQANDIEAIETRAANPKTAIDERLREHLGRAISGAARRAYESLSGRPGHEWALWEAAVILADELTSATSGVRVRAEVSDSIHGLVFHDEHGEERNFFFKSPYGLGASWHCPDLLSALYLQLYLLATRHKPMRRCENPTCAMPFPATRKGRRFCNSTCRSNARNYPKP